MTEDEITTRVAKRLAIAGHYGVGTPMDPDHVYPSGHTLWSLYVPSAKAAIEEYRLCTEGTNDQPG